ncbi:UNVERIFIED_CONTAM: hypothetical protein K2H54_048535 [Gekko kuhli]
MDSCIKNHGLDYMRKMCREMVLPMVQPTVVTTDEASGEASRTKKPQKDWTPGRACVRCQDTLNLDRAGVGEGTGGDPLGCPTEGQAFL